MPWLRTCRDRMLSPERPLALSAFSGGSTQVEEPGDPAPTLSSDPGVFASLSLCPGPTAQSGTACQPGMGWVICPHSAPYFSENLRFQCAII